MIQDSIVVGAGQAGLGTSYFLQKNGLKHTVFEQGRIGAEDQRLLQRTDDLPGDLFAGGPQALLDFLGM